MHTCSSCKGAFIFSSHSNKSLKPSAVFSTTFDLTLPLTSKATSNFFLLTSIPTTCVVSIFDLSRMRAYTTSDGPRYRPDLQNENRQRHLSDPRAQWHSSQPVSLCLAASTSVVSDQATVCSIYESPVRKGRRPG